MIPATEDELSKDKMIIYGILNNVNGKWYFGQTKKTFKGRYPAFQWWKTGNRLIKNAEIKYGKENFSIFIFERNVGSADKMSDLEKEYIQKYNSIVPNGYNIEKGGRNRRGMVLHETTIQQQSKSKRDAHRKNYELVSPTGELIKFTSIVEFCEEYKQDTRVISRLLKRSYGLRTYNGWHLPTTDTEFFFNSEKIYEFEDMNGNLFKVKNLQKFADEKGIRLENLYLLNCGEYSCSGGFKKPGVKIKRRTNFGEKNGRKKYEYITLEKNGIEYKITDNIVQFCSNNGLNKPDLYAVLNKRQKSVHGFIVKNFKFSKMFLDKNPNEYNGEIQYDSYVPNKNATEKMAFDLAQDLNKL